MGENTEKIDNEQRSSETSAALRKFFSLVSHDIKAQLATVRSYSELLAGSSALREDDREVSVQIQTASFLLQIKINNLVNAGRIENSLISYDRKPFNIKDLCDAVSGPFEPFTSAKGLELQVNVNAESIVVGDIEKIEEVLVNLIYFTLQRTARGGAVAVTGEISDSRLLVSVESTKGRFSDSDRALIDTILKEKTSEKGELGLFVSAVFVEADGGDLKWCSSEDGRFSFFFSLPLHQWTDLI
ncbi:MAG: sensor histidine kinase [Candidatus Xenobiia bacterium LiM19]